MRIRKKFQVIPTNAKLENGYSTSDKNGYTCDYINSLNEYSTEEVRIGTYLGKPLYRKVISNISIQGVTSGGYANVSTGLSNVVIRKVNAVENYTAGSVFYQRIVPVNNAIEAIVFTGNGSYVRLYPSDGSISLGSTTDLTIEYTKTTD